MPTTLHEWVCKRCNRTAWSRTKPKPRDPNKMFFNTIRCQCGYLMREGTGNTRKHYSLRELL